MKKAVYRLILFAAITAFVLSLSPSVKAEPNDTQTKQNQHIASDTKTLSNADKQEPAHHQKSAASKENSQLQLAKEQLRGDFYKDSQDNLKLALVIIVTFVVGLILYTIFKDRKEYEKACDNAEKAYNKAELARTQAEKACDKAREYERQAQGILADIGKQAKTKLEEIDTKANDKQANIGKLVADKLEEIEKTSEKQREESSSEFERQRKISELFNKGWKAGDAKDYETAADCYRQIVEEMKEENDVDVYNNWGAALSDLAESKKGKEAEKLFKQAIEKYKKALELNPDDSEVYDNWGDALLYLAQLKGGKDAEDLLKQAEEKCLKAESIKTGEGAYNLACVYARRGNEDKCQEWLKVGEKAGILDSREHAMANDDLKSFRDKDWFKKLRWKGE